MFRMASAMSLEMVFAFAFAFAPLLLPGLDTGEIGNEAAGMGVAGRSAEAVGGVRV
jgi:hypothetical protein